MDYDIIQDQIATLGLFVEEFYSKNIKDATPGWSKINWHQSGPANLYEEFQKVAGWYDYVISKLLDFEQEKNKITSLLNDWKVDIEGRIDEEIANRSKGWVMTGFAYQERLALAKISVGEDVRFLAKLEVKLERLNSQLAVIKAKAKQLADFKADAKTASQLMNFGHVLGELK
jgi:hypothetical protein